MEQKKTHFELKELITESKNNLNLPTVQRGFVWKPYQIENLWDSLLRGYPIGSFVVAQKPKEQSEERQKLELLDGQQRASAICLGFSNPLNDDKVDVFRVTDENIMIFIDLAKPEKNDNRKYIFRVITKSHPWGYQKNDNQKRLESKKIQEALDKYREKVKEKSDENMPPNLFNFDYLKEPLKNFTPQDAVCPIPFGLFLNAESIEKLREDIKPWQNGWNLSQSTDEFFTIEEIFQAAQNMLKAQYIPLTYLDFKSEMEASIEDNVEDANEGNTEEDNNEEERLDNIENLFIRLNAGGTPIAGEELNYSILKNKISRESQEELENCCKGFIAPARFVTLLFNLYKNDPEYNRHSPDQRITLKISPRQFQREVGKNEKFEKYILDFCNSGYTDKVKKLLVYNKDTNDCGLPEFIMRNIPAKAPEVIFMLLYRLSIKTDEINEHNKQALIGLVTLFYWLGRGENQRDHSILLRNIWSGMRSFSTERFWSSEIVHIVMSKQQDKIILPEMPEAATIKELLTIEKNDRIKKFNLNNYGNKITDSYSLFFERMLLNRELILYAQRNALNRWFIDINNCELEDHNIPFDWDHIAPKNLIHKQRKISPELRSWYETIGNFRAWPYSLNRSDSDIDPRMKFNPNKEDGWVKDYIKFNVIKTLQLKEKLLEDSFCDVEWCEQSFSGSKDLQNGKGKRAKSLLKTILNRNKNLLLHWYETLLIEELIPEELNVKEVMNKRLKINQSNWVFDEEENDYDFEPLLKIEKELYLYFKISLVDPLGDDKVEFGLRNSHECIEHLKISKNKAELYLSEIGDTYDFLYNTFILNSLYKESLDDLFFNLRSWLDGLPEKGLNKSKIIEKFEKSLKKR